MRAPGPSLTIRLLVVVVIGTLLVLGLAATRRTPDAGTPAPAGPPPLQARKPVEMSGWDLSELTSEPWGPTATLEEVARKTTGLGFRAAADFDRKLRHAPTGTAERITLQLIIGVCFNYEGQPQKAYALASEIRQDLKDYPELEREWLGTVLYYQGVTALRWGENENCILCRGESSCILPINRAAVHINPRGSRLAIGHFTEYLDHFPDDLEVKWLLNLAHMTLGEHPHQVDPRYLLPLDHFQESDAAIGRFRDIGHLVGVNRLNQAGGAIMDDFDNDAQLDLFTTSSQSQVSATFCRNAGNGTFADCSAAAGLTGQLGGLNCVQTDYNSDGWIDVFIVRGAWLDDPIRPSLLRNEGDGTFTDATFETGVEAAVNSNAAAWADYDHDGALDLFICCEKQAHRLYRNLGNGTFQNVFPQSGIVHQNAFGKGCAWIDSDNDRYPDLYLQNFHGTSQLFRNERNGTFRDATRLLGEVTHSGFSCWAFDYDNDGWLDLFATSYDRTLGDVVRGLIGEPHERHPNRLYRNKQGNGFEDIAPAVGLDVCCSTMGSNYADFDNDGFLDMYLGTGDPSIATLVPNRMFRNLGGKRFAEITASAGVGHLQKGHGVACGDWDRDGNIDLFIEMGGAVPGDRYHNVLFQNPGQAHAWLRLKLVGQQTNRAAIGARIKIVTEGSSPQTIHRHISSGSSFGANPLEQTIGLGAADRVALLEIAWPTSGTTQTFRDLPVRQSLQITEFADSYRTLNQPRIPLPEGKPEPRSTARLTSAVDD